jgi:hypothetical protein
MSDPAIKAFVYCRKTDVYAFTRTEVSRRGWPKLYSVGQVNSDPNLSQGPVGGVFDESIACVAWHVVVQDQSGAVSDRVVALVQGKFGARFFLACRDGTSARTSGDNGGHYGDNHEENSSIVPHIVTSI